MIDSLSAYFKPEFLNRFDSIIQFDSLDKDDLVKIVDLLLKDLSEQLKEQNLTVHVTNEAKEKSLNLVIIQHLGLARYEERFKSILRIK